MRVLVGCEFSGRVREAFRRRGHDAWSCDFLPAEDGSPYHIRGDVRPHLREGWDIGIFHPPCTYLCNSGVRWLYGGKGTVRDEVRWRQMEDAVAFFLALLHCPIPHVAVENPVMHGHAQAIIGPPSQTFQPWHFGERKVKRTCLWLRDLPPLTPTDVVGPPPKGAKGWNEVHYASPGPDRWKLRSATYQGIADAMGAQWGALAAEQRDAA